MSRASSTAASRARPASCADSMRPMSHPDVAILYQCDAEVSKSTWGHRKRVRHVGEKKKGKERGEMKASEAGAREEGRRGGGRMPEEKEQRDEEKRRRGERAFLVSRANSIFDSASRHSRLRQGSKIDYSSITLRLSYPLPFLLLGSLTCLLLLLLFLSPSSFTSSSSASSGGSLPSLPSVQLPRLLSSLSSPCPPVDPSDPGSPLRLLRGSSPPFRSSVIAS